MILFISQTKPLPIYSIYSLNFHISSKKANQERLASLLYMRLSKFNYPAGSEVTLARVVPFAEVIVKLDDVAKESPVSFQVMVTPA